MSNFSKFKRGDRVKNRLDSPGTVLKTSREDGEFIIYIEMDSGLKTDYKQSELKFYHKDIEKRKLIDHKYIGDNCPKCGTKWKKTSFGAKTWYDCLGCKRTAEDILSHGPPPVPKDDDDMFEQLRAMLDDDDLFINCYFVNNMS